MIDPIDDLIQPLLIAGPLSDIDKLKLHEALLRLSNSGLRAKQVTNPHLADASVTARTIADGAIIASALSDSVKSWNTDTVFSATDEDTVAWTSGTLRLADGTASTISAGNTGNMTALTYIYYDSDTSVTVLQTSTAFADSVGNNKILLCVAEDTTDATQEAFYIPSIGVLGINETIIGPNSISTGKIQALAITVNEIAANTITAAKMNVSLLSAITANLGTITAGTVTGATIKTAASGRRIEMDSTNGLRSYSTSGALRAQLNDDDLSLQNIGPVNASDNMLFGDGTSTFSPTGTRRLITGISVAASQTYIEVAQNTSGGTDSVRIICANVQRHSIDGNGDWTIDSGDFTITSGTITGNGSGLTTLNASNLSSGTVADARLPSTVVHDDETNTFSLDQDFSEDCDVSAGQLKIKFINGGSQPTPETNEVIFWFKTGDSHYILFNDGTNVAYWQRDGTGTIP
jgi:hypothetical protein